jgi:hypothetical protein
MAALTFGVMAVAWALFDSKWEAHKFARVQERRDGHHRMRSRHRWEGIYGK